MSDIDVARARIKELEQEVRALRQAEGVRERRMADLYAERNGLRGEVERLKERISRLVSVSDEYGRGI